MNEWPAAAHEVNVRFIQSGGFSGQAAGADFNPGVAQTGKAATGNLRVGIFNRRDDAFDTGVNQQLSAR